MTREELGRQESEPVRDVEVRPRSFDMFQKEDLDFLAASALDDVAAFERRHPRHLGLAERLICVALCQGAAQHLVHGTGGVHDFDVWSFFRSEEGRPEFPVRRRATRDFQGPRFVASSRRIDLLGRTIADLGSPMQSLAGYLGSGRTTTSRALAERPAFILHPVPDRGAIDLRTAA
jgi:hypothetical protein